MIENNVTPVSSGTQSFNDPRTSVQRPSSAKMPDSTHVLTRTFGFLFYIHIYFNNNNNLKFNFL